MQLDLRDRVDAERQEVRQLPLVREAEGVAHRDARLLHRRRGERGEADDVARGVDARHCGAVVARRRRRSRACRRTTPTSSRPMPSVQPERPLDGEELLASRAPGRSRACVTMPRPDTRRRPWWSGRGGTSTPSDCIALRRRSAISVSRNGRRRGPALDERTPSTRIAANIDAYSQPMTPPPRMIIDFGSRSICRMVSESSTSSSSKGMPAGWCGVEPVATRKTSLVTRRGVPPVSVTSIVCASTKRATPLENGDAVALEVPARCAPPPGRARRLCAKAAWGSPGRASSRRSARTARAAGSRRGRSRSRAASCSGGCRCGRRRRPAPAARSTHATRLPK